MTRGTLLVASVVIAVAACGTSATAPTSIAGTYLLNRINGASLPGILEATASDTIRATGGSLTLRNDGTWTSELQLAISNGTGTVPNAQADNGTYSRTADLVTLRHAADGSVFNATLLGTRLVGAVGTVTLEYQRQ